MLIIPFIPYPILYRMFFFNSALDLVKLILYIMSKIII